MNWGHQRKTSQNVTFFTIKSTWSAVDKFPLETFQYDRQPKVKDDYEYYYLLLSSLIEVEIILLTIKILFNKIILGVDNVMGGCVGR